MKLEITNTDGDAPKALAIGKRLFNAIIGDGKLERAGQWVDGGDIYYICALKMGSIQRLQVVNVNPFKITAAANDEVDGLEYPSIQWQGGTPPFQVQVVYKDADGVYQTAMTGKLVNLDTNLIDGTGDSTTDRNYYLYRVTDIEGWWADDGTGAKQDAIGFLITDSVGRKLFAPFAPAVDDPLAQLYSHYGPPEWCEPPIDWPMPATMVYGDLLDAAYLNAAARVPGTVDSLAGGFTYKVTIATVPTVIGEKPDGGALALTPTGGYKPSATSEGGVSPNVLPVTVEFQATDSVHYHLATLIKSVTISKAAQSAYNTFAVYILRNTLHPEIGAYSFLPGDTGWFLFYHPGTNDPWVTPPPSGGNFMAVSLNTNVLMMYNGGVADILTRTGNSAGSPFEKNGTVTGFMVGFVCNTVGRFAGVTYITGTNDYEQSENLYFFNGLYGVVPPMNAAGGIYFDITDTPATYGTALDFTLTNNSGIAPNAINYPAKSDPANPANTYQDAGFSVDPVIDTEGVTPEKTWGAILTPNLDGTGHAYSITATFHPNDLATYPEMGYEQWLTVTKDTPVILYTPPAMTYGDTWNKIKTAKAYNSHHINLVNGKLEGEAGWEIPGTFTYTIQNKVSNNGVISDFSVIPTAGFNTDTNVKDYFDIQVSGFVPSGPKAYCYNNNAAAVVATNQHIERFVTSITATPGNTNITQGGTFSWSNVVSVVPPGRPSYYSDASPDNGVTAIGNSYRFDQAGTFTVRLDTAISPNGDADIANDFISWTINVGAGMYIVSYSNDLYRKITFAGGTGPYSATVYNVTNVCLVTPIGPDYVQITPCNPQNSWCHNNGYVRISDSAGHHVDAYLSNFQSGAQPPPTCSAASIQGTWNEQSSMSQFVFSSNATSGTCQNRSYDGTVTFNRSYTWDGAYTLNILDGGTVVVNGQTWVLSAVTLTINGAYTSMTSESLTYIRQ